MFVSVTDWTTVSNCWSSLGWRRRIASSASTRGGAAPSCSKQVKVPLKGSCFSPSITARRAPADWRPGRRRSRLQRGSWGLITDPGGQGRVRGFKLTASAFMASSETRSPVHRSHGRQTLVFVQSEPDSSTERFIQLQLRLRRLLTNM